MRYRLDHLGLATKDLEHTRRIYQRMGFNLSPLSVHSGPAKDGTGITPWGSGNHLAMLQDSYFELLGLVDETLPSNVKNMVAKYQGLHVLALRCESAQETYEVLRAANVPARAPIVLERDAYFGFECQETRRVQFRNIYLDESSFPEARYIFIEHRNPEIMWQPHLMRHPNGAQTIAGAYLAIDDFDAAAKRLAPIFGQPEACSIGWVFTLVDSKLWLSTPERLQALSPVFTKNTTYPLAAAAIQVESLAALRQLLSDEGIDFSIGKSVDGERQCIWVGAEAADHGLIQFI